VQTVVAIKGPNQERAEDSLTENVSDLGGGKIVADFAAILAELNHLRVEGMHTILQVDHRFSYLGG